MKLKHIGIAVTDIRSSLDLYRRVLNYTLVSDIIFDPLQKVQLCFLNRQMDSTEPNIELIAPAAEESPIRNILRMGFGAYHMCFEVPDIRDAAKEAVANGCVQVAAPVPAVAFDGRLISWIMTPTRHLIEFLEAD